MSSVNQNCLNFTSPWELIIFDLDGTTLTSNKKITPRFKKAVEEASRLGVHFAFASGRSLESIREIISQLLFLKNRTYIIACNGSLVWDNSTNHFIATHMLERDNIINLLQLGHQIGFACYFIDNRTLYTTFPVHRGSGSYLYSGLPVVQLKEDEIGLACRTAKMMFIESVENLNHIETLIPEGWKEKYHFVRSEKNHYEVMSKNTHKGTACQILSDYTKIPPEKIIAVGDEANDKEMLAFAGLGIAMGNAREEIKEIAGWITATNDEDGAAKVIEEYVTKCISVITKSGLIE